MSIFHKYVEQKEVISNYMRQCMKFFSEIGDAGKAQAIDELLQSLDKHRFNITILGSMNRGKSTLLNTLMERKNDDIAPINTLICTASILRYQDVSLLGEDMKETAYIHFHNSEEKRQIPLTRVKEYITEQKNAENAKGVSHVEVYGKFPSWSKAVTLVDSPGLNSVHAYHDDIVLNHLPSSDALVVLIAADLPMDGGDINMLQLLRESYNKKIFFVMSKKDAVEAAEVEEIESDIVNTLENHGFPSVKLYSVAAGPVYKAICEGIDGDKLDELKEEHGLKSLEGDLEVYIKESSEELNLLVQRVNGIASMTRGILQEYIDNSNNILQTSEFDIQKNKLEKEVIEQELESLRRNLHSRVGEFSSSFDNITEAHVKKVEEKLPYIESNLREIISGHGFIQTILATTCFKKTFSRKFEEYLIPLYSDLREDIEKLSQTLDDNMKREVKKFTDIVGPHVLGSRLIAASAVSGVLAGGATSAYMTGQATCSMMAWVETAGSLAEAAATEGLLTKVMGAFTGSTPTKVIAGNLAMAKSVFFVAAIKAIISMVVLYVIVKIAHIGIKKIQIHQLSGILVEATRKICNENKSKLAKWKEDFISEYRKQIDSLIESKKLRVKEIEAFLQNDTPEERELLSTRMENAKQLCCNCDKMRSEICNLTLA